MFGSVLRGQDTDDSVLVILVDPTPETTMMDVAAIQAALQRLLNVPVDVWTPRALPDNFRSVVLAEATTRSPSWHPAIRVPIQNLDP